MTHSGTLLPFLVGPLSVGSWQEMTSARVFERRHQMAKIGPITGHQVTEFHRDSCRRSETNILWTRAFEKIDGRSSVRKAALDDPSARHLSSGTSIASQTRKFVESVG